MTKFFLQTPDPNAPTVLNGRGPFIPFAWVGHKSGTDYATEGLVARDLWWKLKQLGIDERPLCMAGVMGWALQVRHNTARGESYLHDNEAYTEYDQIIRLWNGDRVDIGGPLAILRKFASAMMHGYDPAWPRFPTYIADMHEGSHMVRYIPEDHPVHKRVVPYLSPKINPYIDAGAERLYRRAVNGETRETRRVMERMGEDWNRAVLSRENIYGESRTVATDGHGTLCKTMYESHRNQQEINWIAGSARRVPWLDPLQNKETAPLIRAMDARGTERCGVFCGNAEKLTPEYADALGRLSEEIRTMREE